MPVHGVSGEGTRGIRAQQCRQSDNFLLGHCQLALCISELVSKDVPLLPECRQSLSVIRHFCCALVTFVDTARIAGCTT